MEQAGVPIVPVVSVIVAADIMVAVESILLQFIFGATQTVSVLLFLSLQLRPNAACII